MAEKWYDCTPQQAVLKLKSDTTQGLTKKEANLRLRYEGKNIIYPIPRGSFKSYLKYLATDFTSILLIITAFLSAFFEKKISAAVMIIIVIINFIAAVFTYTKAQRVLEDMGQHSLPTAKVIRENKLYLIKQELLVRGDIIYISTGDIIPADARLIESDRLYLNESNLDTTIQSKQKGHTFIEYRDIPASEQKNMVFAGTIVTNGTAKAVVCETGENTVICKTEKNSPVISHDNLEVLKLLKKYCSVWSLVMIALIFVITILDIFIGFETRGLFNIFLTGLSLSVASMSEFFAAFGYIIIACGIFSASRKSKDINSGAYIKNISKLASLRDITCLIAPRESFLSVKFSEIDRIVVNGNSFDSNMKRFAENARQILKYAVISTGIYGANKLIQNNLLNENTYNPEEEAIISASFKCKVYNSDIEADYPMIEHAAVSKINKFETTLTASSNENVAVIRGEGSLVLLCCSYICENGRIFPITSDKRNELNIQISQLTKEAFRVIGIASKNTDYNNLTRLNACQKDMIFEGFLCIREPLLVGAAINISKLQKAGIKVIMTTAEMTDNNRYIAAALGIIKNDSETLTSTRMSTMRDGLLRADCEKYRLYSGLDTNQKRKMIQILKDNGEKIGILNRELDEIILLKEADVGFSQSITLSKTSSDGIDITGRDIPVIKANSKENSLTGCEALKFISDVIVSEPDKPSDKKTKYISGGFNSMAGSVACSKIIYKNILRTLEYLITSQLARFFIVLFSIITKNVYFDPIQLLFCGLIIDFLAVIVIAFEKPSYNIFENKIDIEKKLKNPFFKNFQAVFFAASCVLYTVLAKLIINSIFRFDSAQYKSALFIGFVLVQLILIGELKKDNGLLNRSVRFNNIWGSVIVFIILFIILCLNNNSIGEAFGVINISFPYNLIALLYPLFIFVIIEVYKIINHKIKNRKENKNKNKNTEEKYIFRFGSNFQIGADDDDENNDNIEIR